MEDWGSMPQHFLTRHVRPPAFGAHATARICLIATTMLIGLSSAGDAAVFVRRVPMPAAPRPAVTARPAPNFARPTATPSRPVAGPAQPAGPGAPAAANAPAGGTSPLAHGPGGALPEHTGQPPQHTGQPQEHGLQPLERGPQERGPQEHAGGRPNEPGRANEAGRNNEATRLNEPGRANEAHRESSLGRPELGRGNAPVNAFRNGGFPAGMPRNGLPRRPFIGEAGFTGVPPRGETRFISNEMVFHVPSNVAPATVDAAARRLGLVTVASHNLSLSGGTLMHFRIDNGRPVSDVVRELEGQNIGVAQPNYVYRLQQDARTPAPLQLPRCRAAIPRSTRSPSCTSPKPTRSRPARACWSP